MRVRDVMVHDFHTLQSSQSVASAVQLFVKEEITGAPVIDHGKLVGMLSEKDIFRSLYPSVAQFADNPELWLEETELEENATGVAALPVEQIMQRHVICVPPDAPLMQAGSIMLAHRVHRLVVQDGDKVVGLLTRSAVFRNVFKQKLS
ncbi:MAG: CBS domain-containing protein [Patescibacteria group bacterium]|jgi:CBS domain-containing protein